MHLDRAAAAPTPGRRAGARLGLLVAVLSLVGTLGGVEAWFRFFAPVDFNEPPEARERELGFSLLHVPSTVPGLEYELRPNAAQKADYFGGIVIHTNSHGMRGPEVSAAKPPGVYRIAVVGDSFTFGHGVSDEDCYPAQLQRLLDEHLGHECFEVLNFGISGYSTLDEAVLISDRVLAFQPDVIVLGYVFNDPEEHPDHDLHRAFHHYGWLDHLHVYRRLLEARWKSAQDRAGGYFELLHDPRGPYWPTVGVGFERIRALAQGAGVPVVLAIFPILGAPRWEAYGLQYLHEQVSLEGAANGFLVCDLLQRLPHHIYTPRQLQIAGNGHANPKGNELIAYEIGCFLRESFPYRFR